jgi:hypothetical protein
MARFNAGQIPVLVCTSAFGEGVDNKLGRCIPYSYNCFTRASADIYYHFWFVSGSRFCVSLFDSAEHDQVFPGEFYSYHMERIGIDFRMLCFVGNWPNWYVSQLHNHGTII